MEHTELVAETLGEKSSTVPAQQARRVGRVPVQVTQYELDRYLPTL